MTVCKGCGATIQWIEGAGGTVHHPVDPERLTLWLLTPALVPGRPLARIVTDAGTIRTGVVVAPEHPGSERIEGYVTHFATCPQAAEFRRRR